ncbi:ribose 5-phosphate isomerase B [Natroniella acetigena]|uniref:ribose 5-phosphate isomerase B n=1 Tax=Natroniella acetigena TaxID=52004 RepID=UPI00200B7EFA|nr:ribose 5-phosphate isomerase B [Natroniella acetigena]MCK8828028.1 ribose 5-phosphate isomerase B [Natroniella acetigena]
MKVALGSDHGGYNLKSKVQNLLDKLNIGYDDFGTDSCDSVDYPDFAKKVAVAVKKEEYERGILICGTGIGMSIAANKVKGVRAALCHDVFSAKATRQHNNSNVLTLGERVVGSELALEIVKVWLTTEFDGGRHQRRIDKIGQLEA